MEKEYKDLIDIYCSFNTVEANLQDWSPEDDDSDLDRKLKMNDITRFETTNRVSRYLGMELIRQ